MQAAPSQAELLFKSFLVKKEKLKFEGKDKIMEKYGNAASEEPIPRELLLGQSEKEIEYDRTGRIIKGQVHNTLFCSVIILPPIGNKCR
jgi:pre-mRNA-processing factor SLU7